MSTATFDNNTPVASETPTPTPTPTKATEQPTDVEQKALLAKFNTTVSEFTTELKAAFPELKDVIEERYDTLSASDGTVLAWFVEHAARPHHLALTTKDNKLFKENDAMFLLPDINFSLLWKCKLTKANKVVIWKYLHVLLLLVSHMQLQHAAASVSNSTAPPQPTETTAPQTPEAEEAAAKMQETFRQWGSMLDGQKLTEAEMQSMRMHADSMMKLMQSLGETGKGDGECNENDENDEDDEDEQSSDSNDEDEGSADSKSAASSDPAAFAEKLKNDPFMKQLESSNIAKFAQELSTELSMEDLGLSADAKMESFQDVFGAIGKNPNGLMGLVQSVGNKIQNKMQSGDIKQTDLVAEAHHLMQSMQGSSALKEMMQAMGNGGGGRKGRRRGRGKSCGGGGGIPGFNPQQLFQTVAKQMQNYQPSPADMAAMQQMMQQGTGNTPGTEGPGSTSTSQSQKSDSNQSGKKKRKGKKGRRKGGRISPPNTEAAIASEQLD